MFLILFVTVKLIVIEFFIHDNSRVVDVYMDKKQPADKSGT